MRCPVCGFSESKVIDSRPNEENSSIKRRRECLKCQTRFTTFESVEKPQIFVEKKDHNRELFDKNKILSGIIRACYKRPVSSEQMEAIANDIETELQNAFVHEISTREIGDLVMEKLKTVDDVAYVRFASVYREFKDVDTFVREIENIKNSKRSDEPEN